MGREANFNFIPAHQLANHARIGLTVSFGMKNHFMTFNLKAAGVEELINVFIKFYVDKAKNTLAWRMFDEGTIDELSEHAQIKEVVVAKGARQIRVYLPANVWKNIQWNPDTKKHLKLPVKTYKPTGMLNVEGDFHYVTIEK